MAKFVQNNYNNVSLRKMAEPRVEEIVQPVGASCRKSLQKENFVTIAEKIISNQV